MAGSENDLVKVTANVVSRKGKPFSIGQQITVAAAQKAGLDEQYYEPIAGGSDRMQRGSADPASNK